MDIALRIKTFESLKKLHPNVKWHNPRNHLLYVRAYHFAECVIIDCELRLAVEKLMEYTKGIHKRNNVKRIHNPNHAPSKAYAEARRRTRTSSKNLTPLELVAISSLYKECSSLSNATGVPHHVDHIIALKAVDSNGRHVACGLHVIANLQILTAKENLLKSNHFGEYLYGIE